MERNDDYRDSYALNTEKWEKLLADMSQRGFDLYMDFPRTEAEDLKRIFPTIEIVDGDYPESVFVFVRKDAPDEIKADIIGTHFGQVLSRSAFPIKRPIGVPEGTDPSEYDF